MKGIQDFPNYFINKKSDIFNKSGKLLKPANVGGYLQVRLYNPKPKTFKVHRLVALTFLPNPENKQEVDHIDKNPLNNNIENLRWVTSKENAGNRKSTPKEIKELVSARAVWRVDVQTNEKLELYNSLTLAEKWLIENGKTNSINIKGNISNVARNKTTSQGKTCISAYGYKWIFEQDDETEIWKEIPSYLINGESGYKISNNGRIKNKTGRIGKGSFIHHSGYVPVTVTKSTYLIHRLVAQVFIDNPENKPQVEHKDGNRHNNNVKNLMWVTSSENNDLKYERILTHHIHQHDLKGVFIKSFKSFAEASRILGINPKCISNCCKNKQNTAGGFKWFRE